MAVHTAVAEDKAALYSLDTTGTAGGIGWRKIVESTYVAQTATASHSLVALLAKLRRPVDQQRWVIGPMRTVADHAIFGDRFVLPQERPAFFRMAFITILVEGKRSE